MVNQFTELWDCYAWFKKAEFFKILEIKDQLKTEVSNIIIVFNYDEKIIAELEIRYEEIPP